MLAAPYRTSHFSFVKLFYFSQHKSDTISFYTECLLMFRLSHHHCYSLVLAGISRAKHKYSI